MELVLRLFQRQAVLCSIWNFMQYTKKLTHTKINIICRCYVSIPYIWSFVMNIKINCVRVFNAW